MPTSLFSTLPADVQRQLKLCGITSDAQLAIGNAHTIMQELQTAKQLFPRENISLTEPEIRKIIRSACSYSGIPEKETPVRMPEKEVAASEPIFKTAEIHAADNDEYEASSSVKKHGFQHGFKSANRYKSAGKAITSGHPFLLWFGAFSCALVPLFLITLICTPFVLLLTDFRPLGDNDLIYAVLIIALILPYLITARLVHCSVCHMNIFTFRSYPYHSKAHRLPLLGVPISTALRILFTFRFTCPACGTKQKLTGKRHRHHHRH